MNAETELSKFVQGILEQSFSGYEFNLISQEYFNENFGNEIIRYDFEKFHLFAVKDRSQLFVELALKNSFLHNLTWLPDVLENIGAANRMNFIKHDFQSIQRQLELLSENFVAVCEALKKTDQN